MMMFRKMWFFSGHTVKLLDLSDDTEQLVRLVGEAVPPSADSDILPVSASSPMGDALMKAHVGETIRVKAPRGTMEFKILEIVDVIRLRHPAVGYGSYVAS